MGDYNTYTGWSKLAKLAGLTMLLVARVDYCTWCIAVHFHTVTESLYLSIIIKNGWSGRSQETNFKASS